MGETAITFLILNGKGAGNEEVRQSVRQLRDEGLDIRVRVTWEQGDAQRYVHEAVQMAAATVIAGGGDGTINEVASALVVVDREQRPCLGILPLGTANDFAVACGIPAQLGAALQLAIKGEAFPIDVGKVNDKRFFINMATGGFGTRITTETPERLKAVLGSVSYFLHGLMRLDTLKADSCVIQGPGFRWAGHALVLAIGNGRQAGGGQILCPDALINDGLLRLRLLIADELLPSLIASLFSDEENSNVIGATLPWLKIKSPHQITFNLDGEPLTGSHFHIEIMPGAIDCRLPPACPLLK